MGITSNLTGHRFGRLLIKHQTDRPITNRCKTNRGSFWLCICDCGNDTVAYISALRNGSKKSCGCINLERIAKLNLSHGHSRNRKMTPELGAHHSMMERCYNKNHKSYHRYGGRGIFVCDRWRDNFANFLLDMGKRPSADLSLERKDNNGPYSPDNCTWATLREQSLNKRTSVRVDGKTLQDIPDETGIYYVTLCGRWRAGDRGERLRRPVSPRKNQISLADYNLECAA